MLIGWSEAELAEASELPKVRVFLDTLFRRDLINLGIYAEATEIVNIERSIWGCWIPLENYLRLLQWTARQLRSGQRTTVPKDVETLLDHLEVNEEA